MTAVIVVPPCGIGDTSTTWTLDLPWPKPPLVLNGSAGTHWARKADDIKRVRVWSATAARDARIPPLRHCVSTLVWTVPDRRRRDVENVIPTAKPAWDGLVDAGVIVDDTPEWITKLMPRIEYVRGGVEGGVGGL